MSTIYHIKALEKIYPMMLFSKTSTETLPLKKPKNPKFNPKTWYVIEKFLVMITYYIPLKMS